MATGNPSSITIAQVRYFGTAPIHAISFTVPQYTAGGDEATYSVTELSSDRKYGYVTSYSSDHDFNAVDLTDNTAQNPIIVTNKLPLTEVTVNKQWEDNDNAYALRPDNIRIKLQRRTVSNNGVPWTSADVGWSDYNASVSGSGSSWSYTFPELPKFDVNNIEYEYRSVETKVNGYGTITAVRTLPTCIIPLLSQ